METNQSLMVQDLRTLAADFAKSGYFQDAREASQAIVKILAGREMGFGPVYSMTKIYVVKGRVMVGAEVMAALVKRSGTYDYRVIKHDDQVCTIEFTENGKVIYTSTFTMADAKKADLVKADGGWEKWPRAMLFSKAMSQGARIACPHLIGGAYTPEDFGMKVNDEGVIEGEVVERPKSQPPTVQEKAEKAIDDFYPGNNLVQEAKNLGAVDDAKLPTWQEVKACIDELAKTNRSWDMRNLLHRIQASKDYGIKGATFEEVWGKMSLAQQTMFVTQVDTAKRAADALKKQGKLG